MGKLIRIKGVTFDEEYILKTIELPDEPVVPDVPDVPDEPVVPVSIDDYPVQDTLLGLYDLGLYDGLGNDNNSLTNHAPEPHINDTDPKLDVGCTVEEKWVTFSGASNKGRMLTYLPGNLANQITYVAMFSTSGWRMIIGNKGSAGIGLGMRSNDAVFGRNAVTVEPDYEGGSVYSDNFVILALTATTEGVRAFRYTNGQLTTLLDDKGVVDSWGSNKFQIGGDSTTTAYDPARISLAAIHEGAMTDDQLESICEFVKKYGEQKGLIIE